MPVAAMMARSVIFQSYRRSFPCFFFFGPERANNFICMKYDNLVTDLRRRNDEAPKANDERNPDAQMTKERLDTLSSFLRHSSQDRAREMMKHDGNPKRSKSAGSLLLHVAQLGTEHSLELPLPHRLPEQFYYRSNISRLPRRSHPEASAR